MDKVDFINKRILVTGGNGYLGRNLIKKLIEKNAKVFCVDIHKEFLIEGVKYFQIDLRNEETLRETIYEIKPDYIYHLAASLNRTRNFEYTKEIFDINVNGTINLLNALSDVNYKNLIFTSTSEVYGGDKIKSPFKEDDDFTPASPYSLSKYTAEMSIKTFSELRNKNFTILRLFNFYGKDMSKIFFLPQLIDKLKKNEDFDMTEGEQLRDYLYIDDVINVLLLSYSSKAYNQVFNVCSGEAKSIKEIALVLKEKLGSKSKINFGALPYRNNEVWEMVGDNNKIKKILEFNTDFYLEDFIYEE